MAGVGELKEDVLSEVLGLEEQLRQAHAVLLGEVDGRQSVEAQALRLGSLVAGTGRPEICEVAGHIVSVTGAAKEAIEFALFALAIAHEYADGL